MTLIPQIGVASSSFGGKGSAAYEALVEAGIPFYLNEAGRRLTSDELCRFAKPGTVGIIAGLERYDERFFRTFKTVRAISRIGVGVDNVDLKCAERSGVKVLRTPDAPTDAVVEYVMGAAFGLTRGLFLFAREMHEGLWKKRITSGLSGLSVGVVGYGRIGRKVAAEFICRGANVYIWDFNISGSDGGAPGLEFVDSLEALLGGSDLITLHASGDQPILSGDKFSLLRDGVMIINSARSGLIDSDSLNRALKSGKVSAAVVDVFDEEPYEGELTTLDNCFCTPHIASSTNETRGRMELEAVHNLLSALQL